VLFAEQRRANNPNLCFNWYSPADARRGRGEALSIRQMVGHMVKHHSIDPARVFVTGLSAGGAMSMVMLATYPEVFAGGAVIAGLPFATANTLSQALEAMRGQSGEARHQLSALVARASDHRGPWPSLSVWHGTSDAIVDPVNAEAILDQWRDLHGVGSQTPSATIVDGYRREAWRNPAGREVIEHYAITGMGHGTPLDPRGESDCGTAGPHMLDVAICSTSRIAQFWGLLGKAGKRSAPRKAVRPVKRDGVGEIIENALRAAGLMP
jgi:poly(hydroxyalkanoate) depolymerase family esterase